MDRQIAITLDMDWVPDEVIEDSLELLAKHSIRATLFMTNSTTLDLDGHELAIHPNFSTTDIERHIEERLNDFPEAKGTRSHSLFFTEHLRALYARYGIEYQSNVMMYLQKRINPLWMSRTTLEIPLYWMDSFYIEMEGTPDFSIRELKLNEEGLKVFCFHPIHIFLNTQSQKCYTTAKEHYNDAETLLTMRNTRVRGIRDIFLELLSYIESNDIQTKGLLEIKDDFTDGSEYKGI